MSAPTRPDGTLADLNGHTHNGQYHSHPGGDSPHDHSPIPGRRPGRARESWGVLVVIVAAAGLWLPWFAYGGQVYSISEANGQCSSGVGQLAQALDAQTSAVCGHVGNLYVLLWLALVVGGGLLAWGLLVARKPQP